VTDQSDGLRREIRSYIEDNYLYLRPDVELGDRDGFLELGIIDSLGFVELVEEVQSRYGVAVDDLEITEENFGSIEAIVGFIDAKRQAA
jgi:acyl carrier protein